MRMDSYLTGSLHRPYQEIVGIHLKVIWNTPPEELTNNLVKLPERIS